MQKSSSSSTPSLRVDTGDDDGPRVSVRVADHETVQLASKEQFVAYRLCVTSETGRTWETHRRWNDLRLLDAALQKTYGPKLKEARVPKVEAHSWRQLLNSGRDPTFLAERQAHMQDILQAYLGVLGVSFDAAAPTGPEPLRAFLAPDGTPGGAATPRATMSNGEGSPGTPTRQVTLLGSPLPQDVLLAALAAADVAKPSEAVESAEADPDSTEPEDETEGDGGEQRGDEIAAELEDEVEDEDEALADTAELTDTAHRKALADLAAAMDRSDEEERLTGERHPAGLAESDGEQTPPAERHEVHSSGRGWCSTWTMVVLWTSLLALPVAAVVAKEGFGVGRTPHSSGEQLLRTAFTSPPLTTQPDLHRQPTERTSRLEQLKGGTGHGTEPEEPLEAGGKRAAVEDPREL